jgi:hypothetical protein
LEVQSGIIDKPFICPECGKPYGYTKPTRPNGSPSKKRVCSSCTCRRKRKRLTEKLLEYKGRKCIICGYNNCKRALQFHHLDPSTKLFTIGKDLGSKSWEKMKAELDKCILLCSNCHAEVESGMHDDLIEEIKLYGQNNSKNNV